MVFVSRHGLIRDDAESYVVLGRNIAKGYGYVFAPGRLPTAWRAPGYVVLLAGIFRLFGEAHWAARVVNAALLTLAAFLSYRFAAQMLPGMFPKMAPRERNAVAMLCAGLIGFYPELVGLTGLLWSENLFIPLFLSAVSALFAFSKRPSVSLALLSGALTACCILTRSTSVILLPVIGFCALRNGFSSFALRNGAIATVTALLLAGCWTARNYVVMGNFILVESNVGYNLYVGNRPDTPMPFAWKRAASLPEDALYQRLNAAPTEGERSAALTKAAVAQIKRDPLRTALLAATKVVDFWLPDFFIALNLQSGALGPENMWLWKPVLALTLCSYLVIVVFAIAGSLRLGLARPAQTCWEFRFVLLIVALYTLPHALVYGNSRYHLPLMPLLFLLAAPVIRRAWLALTAGNPFAANAPSRG